MKYLKTYELITKAYTYDEVKELIDEFIEEEYGAFGSFCDGHYYKKPGDEHVAELKIFLKREGLDLDNFMKTNMNDILKDDFFINANGFMDYLVYTYDKSYLLSGAECMDDADEISIKYEYGYQNTKIGRIYLRQTFGTLANFYRKHIIYRLEDLNINEDNYIIETYDDDNVFLFVASIDYSPKKLFNHLKGDILADENYACLITFAINNISVFIFGNLNITDEKTLDKYIDINDIDLEKLEIRSSANKYNL